MRFRKAEKKKPELDMAPLIDVVFLLLIFFLLSSTFIMQPGITIKLPQATTSEVQPRKDILILIDAKERIFLNDRRIIKGTELKESLGVLVSEGKSKTVVINADESVRHGRVVEVMDVAKQVGVERLVIATQPIELRRR